MIREKMTKACLKKISEKKKIPFPDLLASYVIEEMIYLIAESEYTKDLWLKNPEVLEKTVYEKNQYFSLQYVYRMEERILKTEKLVPGQRMSQELAEMMMESVFSQKNFWDIKWKWKLKVENGEVTADMVAELEEMKVPVIIKVEPLVLQGILPEKKEYHSFFRENEVITYRQNPIECILAEQLMHMVSYLELIPSMKTYYQVYDIISNIPVDGRHIKESLDSLCKEKNINCMEEQGEMISSYTDYAYMRKKWERYEKVLRKESVDKKQEIPSWQEVMKRINDFFLPIWQSICKDEIFFGDWMPELGRYLD